MQSSAGFLLTPRPVLAVSYPCTCYIALLLLATSQCSIAVTVTSPPPLDDLPDSGAPPRSLEEEVFIKGLRQADRDSLLNDADDSGMPEELCGSDILCGGDLVCVRGYCVAALSAWSRVLVDPGEFTCSVLIFFSATLAASAGTGGGGMFVPLLLLFSEIKAEFTVPLSQSMILCSSFANLASFVSQRHPVMSQHAKIDYDCIVLLEPMLCLGVTLGVVVHRVAPQWLLVIVLLGTLGSAFWRTFTKALKQRREEAAMPEITLSPNSQSAQFRKELVYDSSISFQFAHLGTWWSNYSKEINNLLALNPKQLIGIGSVWAVMLVASFFFGRLPIRSAGYCAYVIFLAGFLATCTAIIGRHVVRTSGSSTAAQRAFDRIGREESPWTVHVVHVVPSDALPEEDPSGEKSKSSDRLIDWVTDRSCLSCVRFPSVAFAAGLLGGSLGLGGGIIVSPVLLEVGMHTEAVQATTAAFVFLSSSLATIQYVILGQVMWDYAIWYDFIAIVATALGQYLCEVYVRRHKRYSAITSSIAGVLLFSLTALTFVGVRDMLYSVDVVPFELAEAAGKP